MRARIEDMHVRRKDEALNGAAKEHNLVAIRHTHTVITRFGWGAAAREAAPLTCVCIYQK